MLISWITTLNVHHYSVICNANHMVGFYVKWGKVFKNGPSKICEKQPLKNLK